jgi:uncharacterized membrane protein
MNNNKRIGKSNFMQMVSMCLIYTAGFKMVRNDFDAFTLYGFIMLFLGYALIGFSSIVSLYIIKQAFKKQADKNAKD